MLYRSALLTVVALVSCAGCQSSFRATSPADVSLKAGQAAPMFKLKTLDRKSEVDLARYTGDRPVLLMFGSYT